MAYILIVSSSLLIVSIISSRLLFYVKRKCSIVTIEDLSKIENETLVQFAERHKLFLDQSRRVFLERHDVLINDLVKGGLHNRNRFSELLLGVKSVGKSELCKILRSFMAQKHKQVVTIYISYDSSDILLSKSICQHIASQKKVCQHTIDTLLSYKDAQSRIEALEKCLKDNNIRLFLLIDEFHSVYNKPPTIGEEIVQELSVISGTTRGYIHCIVTGSSSCLRSLAFAKLDPAKESMYKSYSRKIDLNSTKLQPKWIFPIIRAEDFHELLKIRDIEISDIATKYFCSGGRPGLAIEPPNVDDIPYSLGAKHLLTDNSAQATVLKCIFECMQSFDIDYDDRTDELASLERDLIPIPESTLWQRVQDLPDDKRIDAQSFEQILFCLADDGVIIFYHLAHMRMISISCSYVYFQLQQSRTTSLTWREAAALKVPTGYFHEIAEDVAFRFIKKQSKSLFGVELRRIESTFLNLGESKKTSNNGTTFTINSDLEDISYCLHKELVDGKDCCGADGILLVPLNGDKSVRLLRFQLKLGSTTLNESDVTALKNDMFARGDLIEKKLEAKNYSIAEHVCYLITTRHVKIVTENQDSISDCSSTKRTFKILGRKELASAKVWTKEVLCLGQPYSSNKNLDYAMKL